MKKEKKVERATIPSPICLRAPGKISISGLYESCVKCLTDALRARTLGTTCAVSGANADRDRIIEHFVA